MTRNRPASTSALAAWLVFRLTQRNWRPVGLNVTRYGDPCFDRHDVGITPGLGFRLTPKTSENFGHAQFAQAEAGSRTIPLFAALGSKTITSLTSLGQMGVFTWQMLRWLIPGLVRWRTWTRAMPVFYEVGNRTLPVIAITGTFMGLVLAVQSYDQLRAAGFEDRMGVLVTLTLVQELGPVLAGIMVAGRVGGALTAELGTMRVTEQISALTVMGADPIRHLVVPRFLACLLLTPLLTFFTDLCGSLAGWFIAVQLKGISSSAYWYHISYAIESWDILVGFAKSIIFGGCIAMIACFKGFYCRTGAEGVGRACTESFVVSFVTILVTDFFIGLLFSGLYRGLYGFKSLV